MKLSKERNRQRQSSGYVHEPLQKNYYFTDELLLKSMIVYVLSMFFYRGIYSLALTSQTGTAAGERCTRIVHRVDDFLINDGQTALFVNLDVQSGKERIGEKLLLTDVSMK